MSLNRAHLGLGIMATPLRAQPVLHEFVEITTPYARVDLGARFFDLVETRAVEVLDNGL